MDEMDDLEKDDPELAAVGPRRLTPEQQSERRQRLIRRAQAARGQALRDIAGGVLKMLRAAGRGLIDAGRYWWNAWKLRRQRRAAIRELNALDDHMLRDMGLGRSEIESAVGDVDRLLAREFAPVRPLL